MKLKVLPPTLRKNYRYLTVDIKSETEISKDNLVSIMWDACIRFQGELHTADFDLWVMRFFEMENEEDYYCYKAIVRCQRGFVDEVRTSFALSNMYDGSRISMTTIGLSGTIKASEKFI